MQLLRQYKLPYWREYYQGARGLALPHRSCVNSLGTNIVFASSLCFTFPTDFTTGRCPLDPRRGDHSKVAKLTRFFNVIKHCTS